MNKLFQSKLKTLEQCCCSTEKYKHLLYSVLQINFHCRALALRKNTFFVTNFFSKCNQKLRIWSHLLKKDFTENFTLFVCLRLSLSAILKFSLKILIPQYLSSAASHEVTCNIEFLFNSRLVLFLISQEISKTSESQYIVVVIAGYLQRSTVLPFKEFMVLVYLRIAFIKLFYTLKKSIKLKDCKD